jgi:hypothetical protein
VAEFQFSPGWRGIDDTQRALASAFLPLSQAAPRLMAASAAADDSPVLLYQAFRQVLGNDPKYPAQQIGDCVSFGHAHGNDLLQCVEISLGEPASFQETDTEVVYGFAREISGDLGNQDGSYGSAAVKAMMQWGLVSRQMMGSDGTYSGNRAKQYGREGCPQAVKDKARPFKLGNAALANSWDEVVAALRNGCPVTECSNFLPGGKRDADGFVQPSGRGGHCQCIIGVRFDKPGVCIMNSWGEDYYSGPTGLDCPKFAYWITRDIFERWIANSGDNWALTRSPDFALRPWDWSKVA